MLFTKLLSSILPAVGRTSETIPAAGPIHDLKEIFGNCPRQSHGTAGNREAGDFVNSPVGGLVNSAVNKDTTPSPKIHEEGNKKKTTTAFDTVVQSIKNGYQVKTLGQNALGE